MNKILDTIHFSGILSDYTIDLVKNTKGNLHINIHQNDTTKANRLEGIPARDLTILIQKLQHFFAIMNVVTPTNTLHIDDERSKNIVKFYYKNVSIEEIASNFDISTDMVKEELKKKGIPIVSMKPNTYKSKYRKR